MEDYIIINKKWLEDKISLLKKEQKTSENGGDSLRAGIEYWQQEILKQVLKQSKPLQPIIENAFMNLKIE